MDVLKFIESNYEISDAALMNVIRVASMEERTKQYDSAAQHYSDAFMQSPEIFILSFEKALCDLKDAISKYESIDEDSNNLEDRLVKTKYESKKKVAQDVFKESFDFAMFQMKDSDFPEETKEAFFCELIEDFHEQDGFFEAFDFFNYTSYGMNENNKYDFLLSYRAVRQLFIDKYHLLVGLKVLAWQNDNRYYEKILRENGLPDFSIEAEILKQQKEEEKREAQYKVEEETKKAEEMQRIEQENRANNLKKFIPLFVVAAIALLIFCIVIAVRISK